MASPRKGGNFASTSGGSDGSRPWQMQNSLLQQYGQLYLDGMINEQAEEEPTPTDADILEAAAFLDGKTKSLPSKGGDCASTSFGSESSHPWQIQNSLLQQYRQLFLDGMSNKQPEGGTTASMDIDPLGAAVMPSNKTMNLSSKGDNLASEIDESSPPWQIQNSLLQQYGELFQNQISNKPAVGGTNATATTHTVSNTPEPSEAQDLSKSGHESSAQNHAEEHKDSFRQMENFSSALTQQYFLSHYGNNYAQALNSYIEENGPSLDENVKDLSIKKDTSASSKKDTKEPPKSSEKSEKHLTIKINFKKTPSKSKESSKSKKLSKSTEVKAKDLPTDIKSSSSSMLDSKAADDDPTKEKNQTTSNNATNGVKANIEKIGRPRTYEEAKLGCTCATYCLEQFSKDAIEHNIQCIRNMKKDKKEMLVMNTLITFGHGMTRGGKRKRNRYRYTYEDKVVCKTSYCFVYNISIKTLKALQRHLVENGPVPRIHGNKGKKPYHALGYEEVKYCVEYLLEYSNTHGTPMPDPTGGSSVFRPVWLPSNQTKQHIHTLYSEACLSVPIRAIGLSSFRGVWNNCLPHVRILGPKDDIPSKCEDMGTYMADMASDQDRLTATLSLIESILKKEEEHKKRRQLEQANKSTEDIDDELQDEQSDEELDEQSAKKIRNSFNLEPSADRNHGDQYKQMPDFVSSESQAEKDNEVEKAKRMADFMYFEPLPEPNNGEHKETNMMESKFEPPKDEHLMYTHKNVTTFICIVCEKAFLDSSSLKNHMEIHTEDIKPFQCHFCDKSFLKSSALNLHMKLHTGEKPFKCEFCDMAFGDNSILLGHLKTHNVEKTYVCEICDKAFLQNSSLKSHMRVHSGDKPYECEVCEKKLKHYAAFVKHMRLHTGEDPYHCKFCDKTFYDKSNLKEHMKAHEDERPYKCIFCEKAFKHNASYTKHMMLHTGEKV